MKSHPERRDKRRYCRFHREYGHDTEECRDLQYQIEDLIRRSHLRRYVREQPSLPDGRPSQDSSPRPQGLVEKQIDVIFGGPASGVNSSSARKAYSRLSQASILLRDRCAFRSNGEDHRALPDSHLRALAYRRAVTKLYNRRVRPRHALFEAEGPLVLGDRLPRQLSLGAFQVLHGLLQLVVHPPSPGPRLLQQLLGVAQVAPNRLQLLLRDLAPEELFGFSPFDFLELLPQHRRALFDLDDRLRSPPRFQSVKLFLQLLDPIVHECDQSTRIMDSVKKCHLKMLALHERATVRI
ncbi:hypothetical protein B296_00058654 [Ensete ventricosum]|uniref:Uncharacterized protein n=1 Tax=Ensete ventricosum TaxID=4639 RepID=A0A426WVV4_ENSVE|nr:hypothetical protein B296_00058654 [Ensete ventricosum]